MNRKVELHTIEAIKERLSSGRSELSSQLQIDLSVLIRMVEESKPEFGIRCYCSICGQPGLLISRDDHYLKPPNDWEVIKDSLDYTEKFKLVCNNDGCWNYKDKLEDEGLAEI